MKWRGLQILGQLAVGLAILASVGADPVHAALGQLSRPNDVATAGAGSVYVSNVNEIQKFTPSGTFLGGWGSHGSGEGQFDGLSGIAANAAGALYAADRFNSRIQKFDSGGSFLAEWVMAIDKEELAPLDVAIGPFSSVYASITDFSSQFRTLVAKFDADGNLEGKPWGEYGTGKGQFTIPRGIAIGDGGDVYVSDEGGNRVLRFTSTGEFQEAWGSPGTGDGEFGNPRGIATDSDGSVYVADSANDRIQKFDAEGNPITTWGGTGSGDGQFHTPSGIATDSVGSVYVADEFNDRVQKFTPNGGFIAKWGEPPPPPAPPPPAPPTSVTPKPARPIILTAPSGKTAKRHAAIRFTSRQRGVRFQCRLAGERVPKGLKRWRGCTSPKRYTRLRLGKKVFRVRAIRSRLRSAGARRQWRIVKRVGPKPTVIPTTRRKAIFRAICPLSKRCVARVAIEVGKRTLARGRYSVPRRSRRKVGIPLTKAGRHLLARRKNIHAKGTLTDTRNGKSKSLPVVLRRRWR